ncbi:hypothetical protein QOZ80_2AG0131300 [Eleusine coracana subsp. coracana]|nr:hypothetical protein QOZ80_2AG0131300 [Eleusine coracana subsp. coracana]
MAPPRPRPAAPMSSSAAELTSSMQVMLLNAAYNGDLRLLKKLVRALDKGRGRLREAVEAARTEDGTWALHLAAGNEQLEVCNYLVEALRVDVNAADDKGRTPLVFAVISENAAVVKYLLDHGADPNKADDDRLTPLHSAAGIGDCEMIESLLAKGAYVDPLADECGTPLHLAVKERQTGAVKTLLDHNADCNKTYRIFGVYDMTPLFQAVNVSSVECVKLLVEAGADVTTDCMSTVVLDSAMGNDGSTECLNFLLEAGSSRNVNDDEHVAKGKIKQLKSLGRKAIEKNDYFNASAFYTKAMDLDPGDPTLFSNRSLCWLRMGDGKKALQDALECREMRPDWPKAYYRQGASLMLLEDYENASEAFFEGFKLEPENVEIEHALREAMESLKMSKGSNAK